jgi:hypothetical protein
MVFRIIRLHTYMYWLHAILVMSSCLQAFVFWCNLFPIMIGQLSSKHSDFEYRYYRSITYIILKLVPIRNFLLTLWKKKPVLIICERIGVHVPVDLSILVTWPNWWFSVSSGFTHTCTDCMQYWSCLLVCRHLCSGATNGSEKLTKQQQNLLVLLV